VSEYLTVFKVGKGEGGEEVEWHPTSVTSLPDPLWLINNLYLFVLAQWSITPRSLSNWIHHVLYPNGYAHVRTQSLRLCSPWLYTNFTVFTLQMQQGVAWHVLLDFTMTHIRRHVCHAQLAHMVTVRQLSPVLHATGVWQLSSMDLLQPLAVFVSCSLNSLDFNRHSDIFYEINPLSSVS